MRLAAYQFAVCGDIDHNLEIIKKAIVSALVQKKCMKTIKSTIGNW